MIALQTKSNNINILVPHLLSRNIRYQITTTKSNRLVIKYNRKGVLTIRKPLGMKESQLIDFINEHLDWIIEHYDKSQPQERRYQNYGKYLYLGKEYTLEIVDSKYPNVYIKDETIIVYASTNQTKQVIDEWIKKQAEMIFSEVLYQQFKRMENKLNDYPKLEIKKYVSRWGCCYPKQKRIILNISLIHVPLDLIEYVICHELSHLVYPNHSPSFHSFLKEYIPDESLRRKRLKNYQSDYE